MNKRQKLALKRNPHVIAQKTLAKQDIKTALLIGGVILLIIIAGFIVGTMEADTLRMGL